MRPRPPVRSAASWRLALVCLLGVMCFVAACTRETPLSAEATPVVVPTIQPDDMVDLTVYFRSGSGGSAYLEPVVREVPVGDDLPRRAAELLVAGPVEADGAQLRPTLPPETRVKGVEMNGDTAIVDLSEEVLSAAAGFATPENEVLALGALANTLTEFPTINRVRVLVDGQGAAEHDGGRLDRFWGHWGMPDVLVRDESLIGAPREGDGIPDLARFSAEPQEVGVRDAEPVRVAGVRVRERTTYVRVILELADAEDAEAPAAAVPLTEVSTRDEGLVLEVRGVIGVADASPEMPEASSAITDVDLETATLPGTLRVLVDVDEAAPHRLHVLSSPPRIVLDVKR